MADLVTRLLLNNSLFDNSIRQSTQQIQTFQQMGRNITNTLGKFAGVAGLAVSGMELFDQAIHSNARLQDNWNTTIGAAKVSVDNFFTSLTTGDWSVFENGILKAIKLSKDYTQNLQQLKTNLLIGDLGTSQYEMMLNKYDNISSNSSLSKAEREKGFADFKKEFAEAKPYVEQLAKDSNKKVQDMLAAVGIRGFNARDIKKVLTHYYPNFTPEGKKVDMYENWQKDLPSVLGTPKSPEQIKRAEDALARFDKQDSLIGVAAALRMHFPEGEKLDGLVEDVDKVIGLEDRLQTMVAQDISLSQDFDKLGNLKAEASTKTHSTPSAPSKGKTFEQYSLGYYEQIYAAQRKVRDEQSKTNEEYEKANNNLKITQSIIDYIKKGDGIGEYFMLQHQLKTDPNLANLNKATSGQKDPVYIEFDKLNKAEQEWTEKLEQFYLKYNLKGENGLPSIEKFDKYFNDYFSGNKSSVTELEVGFAKGSLNELRAERQKLIDELNNASTQEERVRILAEINKNTKTEQNYLGTDKVKTTNDYAVSLNAVATAMGNISNMTNEGATAWLTWSANLMTAIAAAIPAIQTLTAAKTAEAGANAVASATLTPIVGWLLAGAAAASVIAAMATMPKFADGGIFTGNSTIGDMNLARVNAGEMILNNRLQRNLFNLLNNGGSSTSTNGQVEFKIKGNELVGVLKNYSKKMSRV